MFLFLVLISIPSMVINYHSKTVIEILVWSCISKNLSWSVHYCAIASKAYKTLGLIRRTFSSSSSGHCRKLLYLFLVRPVLTYCSSIWRPHLVKNIIELEKIQRHATKHILNDVTLDYKSRLISLQLIPLMMAYAINDLVFFLKCLKSPTI